MSLAYPAGTVHAIDRPSDLLAVEIPYDHSCLTTLNYGPENITK
jgi:hypothetical protein